jgi:hypothetical protein
VCKIVLGAAVADSEVISTRQVLVLEVGEYQGGIRDRVDGLVFSVERLATERCG